MLHARLELIGEDRADHHRAEHHAPPRPPGVRARRHQRGPGEPGRQHERVERQMADGHAGDEEPVEQEQHGCGRRRPGRCAEAASEQHGEAHQAERREHDEGRPHRIGGIGDEGQHLRQRIECDIEIGDERYAAALGRTEPRHAQRPVRQEMKIAGQQVRHVQAVIGGVHRPEAGRGRQEQPEIDRKTHDQRPRGDSVVSTARSRAVLRLAGGFGHARFARPPSPCPTEPQRHPSPGATCVRIASMTWAL